MKSLRRSPKDSETRKKVSAGLATALLFWGSGLTTDQAEASGSVKSPHEYYFNITRSQETVPEPKPNTASTAGEEFLEHRYYGEYGLLSGPFPLQAIVSGGHKKLTLESAQIGDKRSAQSLTDTRLALKVGLPIPGTEGLPLNTAFNLGFTLPTTPNDYRPGNESKQPGQPPESRSSLIAPLDRGQYARDFGFGVTTWWQSFWADLSYKADFKNGQGDPEYTYGVTLGSGLPMNSWFQLLAFQIEQVGKPLEQEAGAGFGWTFYKGIALEYTWMHRGIAQGPRSNRHTFGLSARSI